MITQELIQGRINHLKLELKVLQDTHNHMVVERNQREQQFEQQLVMNQCRFQQINGAISQLTELLKSTEETNNDTNNGGVAAVGTNPDRVLGLNRGPGGDIRPAVGHRELDQPHPATSKTGLGSRFSGPDCPVGG